jgi:hypothetical protein
LGSAPAPAPDGLARPPSARDAERQRREVVRRDRVTEREAERAERLQERNQEREEEREERAQERQERMEEREAERREELSDREARIAAREARIVERERRIAEREAARADARARYRPVRELSEARRIAHRQLHRVALTIGFAPSALLRDLPGSSDKARSDTGVLRQRTMELGAAYVHDFNPVLGIRAGVSGGVGMSHMDLSLHGDHCCGSESRQVRASYSVAFELAPTISARRVGFYAAPGLVLRLFILPQHRTTLTAISDEDDTVHTRTFGFKSPAPVVAVRPAFGFRFGANHEYDVGFGFDLGAGLRNADAYFSAFARFGVVLSDLALR